MKCLNHRFIIFSGPNAKFWVNSLEILQGIESVYFVSFFSRLTFFFFFFSGSYINEISFTPTHLKTSASKTEIF